MRDVARLALTIARILGIAWVTVWGTIAAIGLTAGHARHRAATFLLVCAFALPGWIAAAIATRLRQRIGERELPRGFEVLPPKSDAG